MLAPFPIDPKFNISKFVRAVKASIFVTLSKSAISKYSNSVKDDIGLTS